MKLSNPRISVITPVYNAEKFLHRCVDSILAQTFQDFELLLVDDGSSDSSSDICDDYAQKDERVRVLHKVNGGVSSARNLGLNNARGEWVTFADSDDEVCEDWLSTFVDNLDGYDAVVTGFYFVTSDKVLPFVIDSHSEVPAVVADHLNKEHNYGFLWCKIFKYSLIENQKLRFNEKLSFLEDEDFVCRYWAESKKIKVVNHATYKYSFPNYDDKYGNIDCFDAFFSLLTTAIKFINNKNSISLTRYSICCHRCLLNSYQKHNYREALIRIKSIARLGHKLCLIPRMRHIQRYNYWIWHFFLILYTLKKK